MEGGLVVLNSERRKIRLCMVSIRPLLGIVVISFSLIFLTLARSDTSSRQKAKLVATDGQANDHFGMAVSIDGDYAIIGSACDDDRGTDSGSAYIFNWNGTGWVQQQKLTAPDNTGGEWYGCAVSISGDYAIVGSRYGDGNAVDSGAAYVYFRNGTNWIQQAKLTADDVFSGACFGISACIDGDKAIVGAFCNVGGGSAYIFRRDGTRWSQEKKLIGMEEIPGDAFGRSVCIIGDKSIVGADGYDKGGAAFMFKWDGNDWVQEQMLTAPDSAAYDCFGGSVSMSGDKIVVGSYWDDDKGLDSGSAYIFKWDGTKWGLEQKLTAADGDVKDIFGYSVSIKGDYIIIGANSDDDKGLDSGSAYIFRWDGTSWVQQQKLTASDGDAESWFGRSVFISGDRAIVGAVLDDGKGAKSGSAYIFEPIGEPEH